MCCDVRISAYKKEFDCINNNKLIIKWNHEKTKGVPLYFDDLTKSEFGGKMVKMSRCGVKQGVYSDTRDAYS